MVQPIELGTTRRPASDPGAAERRELSVDGMSCAACASRVRGGLESVDGVDGAAVNFATGRATVRHRPGVTLDQLRAAVEQTGYRVIDSDRHDSSERERQAYLGRRFVVAAVLSVPLMALSMVPALRFDGWQWLAAALATPVVLWSGWPFHRSAGLNLRHRSTTMDTLVSLGSLAAWTWSTVVLVDGAFGSGPARHVYYETAAVIVTLILLGKWSEIRARRRSGDAIRALADLGASSARLEDGSEVAIDQLVAGMRFLVRPGERIPTDGTVVEGRSAVDREMVTGEGVPVESGPGVEVVGGTVHYNGSLGG
jgi:Cu+-exporting ATPase